MGELLSSRRDGHRIETCLIRIFISFEIVNTSQAVGLGVIMQGTVFCDVMLCSLVGVHWHSRRMYYPHLLGQRVTQERNQQAILAACFLFVTCLAYFLTVKMEAICSTETLVTYKCIAWPHIPEICTLRVTDYCCCFYVVLLILSSLLLGRPYCYLNRVSYFSKSIGFTQLPCLKFLVYEQYFICNILEYL
jgi:hypothetical protein